MHISTKTYNANLGLSCCFRQWRAKSHCNMLHGYALAVRFEFGADDLDECNWVMDFGALKPLKTLLETMFDHKLLVAEDDPNREVLEHLGAIGVAAVNVVPAVGCEAFAEMIFHAADRWLATQATASYGEGRGRRVRLLRVEVSEHGANSAIYKPTNSN